MKHIFIDETQKNEQRLKRARILQQSKKLDKKEIWHGLIIAIFTGIAIAGIIVIALFPAVQAVIDNPGVSSVLIIIGILVATGGYLYFRSANRSRAK